MDISKLIVVDLGVLPASKQARIQRLSAIMGTEEPMLVFSQPERPILYVMGDDDLDKYVNVQALPAEMDIARSCAKHKTMGYIQHPDNLVFAMLFQPGSMIGINASTLLRECMVMALAQKGISTSVGPMSVYYVDKHGIQRVVGGFLFHDDRETKAISSTAGYFCFNDCRELHRTVYKWDLARQSCSYFSGIPDPAGFKIAIPDINPAVTRDDLKETFIRVIERRLDLPVEMQDRTSILEIINSHKITLEQKEG